MSDRYAVLDGDAVVDVVLWDGQSEYPGSERLVACPEEVSVGWAREGGAWAPPHAEEAAPLAKSVAEQRREAYRESSDDLGWAWLAGDIPKSAWLAARQRVKDRYPK